MGIGKELADMMQVWILNESSCVPVISQSSDGKLNLHDVDFYIWMKNIFTQEDAKIFKQQFWHLFAVTNWFNTLTNNKYSQSGSIDDCMHLNAHKKSSPLEHGSYLAQWVRYNPSLTAELAKEIAEPFVEQHAEHVHIGTTWNEASKRGQEKCKTCTQVTGKYPE